MADIPGTDNSETLYGTSGDDVIDAKGGDDVINGSAGFDKIYGGSGQDTVDYSKYNLSIDVQLFDTGAGFVGFANQQTNELYDVENAIGGNQNDNFKGNSADNTFVGAGGDDFFVASLGVDTYYGDDGYDIVDYFNVNVGIYVDKVGPRQLATIVNGSPVDRLFDIEEIGGSIYNDIIKGSRAAEAFYGGAGDDQLFGRGGRDTLSGYLGTDMLTGGRGADTFLFEGEFNNDTVTDFRVRGFNHDVIDIHKINTITSFDDLIKNHATQTSDGVLIDAGIYGTILLEDVALNRLTPDHFVFWSA